MLTGIAVFTLAGVVAGAVTGGAVATSASVSAGSDIDMAALAYSVVGTHGKLVGDQFGFSGAGTATLNIGTMPTDATKFEWAFHCLDAGTFLVSFSAPLRRNGTIICSEADTKILNVSVDEGALTGKSSKTMTVTTRNSARYLLWASWVKEPPTPAASKRQIAETRDGMASRSEYVAAFNRFAGCMSALGHAITYGDETAQRIEWHSGRGAFVAGTVNQCYPKEFEQVDHLWIRAHPDPSPEG